MNAPWIFLLKKRQFTQLVIAGLILWGGAAIIGITKESAPEVQIPIGIVSTVLPGASAEEVERLVTNKIEEQLINLGGLDTLSSTSREGVSIVTAEFVASADIDESIQKLKDEVDKVKGELPEDATEPTVTDINFADQPIQIISVSSDEPFARLAELGETLKTELQGISGVSRIEVSGVRDREIQIVVKKEALTTYQLSLPQVISALSAANASVPVGAIVAGDVSYSVAFEGDLTEVKDLENLPLLTAGSRIIYLRDIATVSDGVTEAQSLTRISTGGLPSEQALTLSVYKVRGEDVTRVTTGVREHLDTLADTVLAGSQVVITNDAGKEVQRDLTQLSRTGIETVLLVLLVLFITIGWREGLIAAASIPLSFLMAFVGLWYSGNTINFVSLFALILAIGILVDSGIVVVEAIHTRMATAENGFKAAAQAIHEYGMPLVSGTLTTVAVFFPLFFISGIVGKFIASIPFTVIFVLLASIFVALGLVPTLTLMFQSDTKKHSRLTDIQETYTHRARTWYRNILTQFLTTKRAGTRFILALTLGFFAVFTLPILGVIPVSFFPQGDLDFMYVDIEMPQGTPLAQTDLAARIVEEALYENTDIESLVTQVGATSAFGNNPTSGSRYATITVNIPTERTKTSSDILTDIQKTLAPIAIADIRVAQPSGGPPVGAPIAIKFTGQDRNALEAATLLGQQVLTKTPGATGVTTSNKDDGMEFVLSVDRARLAQANVSPLQIASVLRTAVSGTTATTLTGGRKDVDVVVSLNLNPDFTDPHEASHTTIDALRTIPITTQTGETVLLGSLLTEDIRRSNASIQHENRARLATVTGNIEPGYLLTDVLASFKTEMQSETLPPGVTMTIGGENEETDQSFKDMGIAFVAGLALMFVILVLSFNSFRLSGYTLLTVPLSLIGVFLGLAITGQALSFPSLLGVIALAGVVVNNAIILIDATVRRVQELGAEHSLEGVIDASVSRLRPVLLTTITTVIGMAPLTQASDLWSPLAWAIIFGLIFATVLTLGLIPLLMYRFPGKSFISGEDLQTDDTTI